MFSRLVRNFSTKIIKKSLTVDVLKDGFGNKHLIINTPNELRGCITKREFFTKIENVEFILNKKSIINIRNRTIKEEIDILTKSCNLCNKKS